jgi:hypothetical protein
MSNELAFEAESYYGDLDEAKFNKELEYILLNLQEEIFKKELADLMAELKKAENAKEQDRATSILQRCNEISKKLHEIKTIRNKIKL